MIRTLIYDVNGTARPLAGWAHQASLEEHRVQDQNLRELGLNVNLPCRKILLEQNPAALSAEDV